MPRVAKPYDPVRIAFLKTCIRDPLYVEGAIDRLAGRISDRLLGLDGPPGLVAPPGHRRTSSSSMERELLRSPDE